MTARQLMSQISDEVGGGKNGDTLLSLKWNNQKSTFFEFLKILREKPNYTDATLAVEGKFYPVHKLVMSTCSEYFSDIFERTPCRSPVIVLKDVQSHDIEALLDYIYLGEVNVYQNDLASLLKTAECLRIKDFALLDENPTKLCKNTTKSHDAACQDSSPPKRQRYDSDNITPHDASPVPSPQMFATALDNPVQTPSIIRLNFKIPPDSNCNPSHTEQNEPLDVKFEMEDEKIEIEDEPLVVKFEVDDAKEQGERIRRENNYEGVASIDQDPGRENWCNFFKTNHLKYIKLMNCISGHQRVVAGDKPIYCFLCNKKILMSKNLRRHLLIYHEGFLLFRAKEEGITKDVLHTSMGYTYADIIHKDLSVSPDLMKKYRLSLLSLQDK